MLLAPRNVFMPGPLPSVCAGTVAKDLQWPPGPYMRWAVSAWLWFCGRTPTTSVEIGVELFLCTTAHSPGLVLHTGHSSFLHGDWQAESTTQPSVLGGLIAGGLGYLGGLEGHTTRVVTFWSQLSMTRSIWDGFYLCCSLFSEAMLLSKPAFVWFLYN